MQFFQNNRTLIANHAGWLASVWLMIVSCTPLNQPGVPAAQVPRSSEVVTPTTTSQSPTVQATLAASEQTPLAADHATATLPSDWRRYVNEDFKFAFHYPVEVRIEVPETGLGGEGPTPIKIFAEADNPFEIYIKTNYLPNEVTYFRDTAPNGTQTLGRFQWQTYELPEGYADATSTSPPLYGLQMEANQVLYVVIFYDQAELTPLQAQILATFEILTGATFETPGTVSSPTPEVADPIMQLIHQVVAELCPPIGPLGEPTVNENGNVYNFGCAVAAGHSLGARITRFPTRKEAQTALGDQGNPAPSFHGCPTLETQYDERTEPTHLPLRHHSHVWQVDHYLIETSTFDDTGIPLIGVLAVSEQIYQTAITSGLIQGC